MIQDLARQRGGMCLDNTLHTSTHMDHHFTEQSSDEVYRFRCSHRKHSIFRLSVSDILSGRWCKQCAQNAPVTIDYINETIRPHGFVFYGSIYTKSNAKYDFKCVTCGLHVNTSWENFKQRCSRGCKQCKPIKSGRGSVNYLANPKPRAAVVIPDERKLEHLTTLQQIANDKGGECLSSEYLGHQVKHLFRCSAGHEWEATSNSIKLGTWCQVCCGKRKDDITSARAFCQENGWVFASPTYTSSKDRHTYKCAKCGFTREMIWAAFKTRAISGCSKCNHHTES